MKRLVFGVVVVVVVVVVVAAAVVDMVKILVTFAVL